MDANHGDELNQGARGYALSGKVMLTSTVVLFSAVLLLLFLHLYLRSRFLLRRRTRRRLAVGGGLLSSSSSSPSPSPSPAPRGLEPAVLKSLPVLVFAAREEEGKEDAVECAVCLSEFEEGEEMRALPQCGHRFHTECIDMWFHSHATCPLCRCAVDATAPAPPPLPAAARQVLLPAASSPREPGRPFPADLCAWCLGEHGTGSSASGSASRELRIEMPARGSEGELGLGMKSPGC